VQHQASHLIAVQTREGRVSATRAEFAVRQFNEFSRVAVLAGEVQINPASGAQVLLRQGEVACLRAVACERQAQLSAQAETAWLDGLLQVSDRSLREVAAALADYRSGFIHVADAVAGLRVSGIFPLDDTNRALSALGKVLPVRIVFNTDYLVRIEAA
jgi:transmembrane sensor